MRFTGWRILQVGAAAGAAWLIATELIGHQRPFFAPIAVVLVLGLAVENRGRRALELALGVALGIGIADLLVAATGVGAWQLVIVVVLAMAAAVLAGGGVLLVNQAAVSAVLVATLPLPDTAASGARFVDALVGASVALAANALFPVDPVRLVRRHFEPLLERLAGILTDIADALEQGDLEAGRAALDSSRALDPAVRELRVAIEAGLETTALAPTRRLARGQVARIASTAEPIDLTVRNVRVLARAVTRAVDLDEHVPPIVVEAVRDLAVAVTALERRILREAGGEVAEQAALRAAARASAALEQTSNLAVSVIIGQVRSTATDLLVGLGRARGEAVRAVRDATQGEEGRSLD